MAIRIAHLSDLHFGPKFDLPLWEAVKAEIQKFAPSIVVVSGDLVDEPSPIQLLAAKSELRTFSAGLNARLYVVPGNHDVYKKGLASALSPRKSWFERIFFNDDTWAAEAKIAELFGEKLGFNDFYKKPSFGLHRPLRLARHAYLRGISIRWLLPKVAVQPLVQTPEGENLLIALLDSNDGGQKVGLATGQVNNKELVSLRAALDKAEKKSVVRIAVVHHHVLPIAVTSRGWNGTEPFMVLHNAGRILTVLAEHKFDLVLHGHKHVPQFARLDMMPASDTGYAIGVVSAGSAALNPDGTIEENCINLITIDPNGQIEVDSLRYGDGHAPTRDVASGRCHRYSEHLSVVKLRARARAHERHKLNCNTRFQSFEITETGDLKTTCAFDGLKALVSDHPDRRDHYVAIPPAGAFVHELLELDAEFSTPGTSIVVQHPTPPNSHGQFGVRFPEGVFTTGAKYRVSYACSNVVKMTKWECRERGSQPQQPGFGWDVEHVSIAINHPTDHLHIVLKLPESFGILVPKLHCQRCENYPNYGIDSNGDARFKGTNWVEDYRMTEFESSFLRFDPVSNDWNLSIHKPMVGYRYVLTWQTPGSDRDVGVHTETLHQRRTLLKAFIPESAKPPNRKIEQVFELLARELAKLLGRNVQDELCATDLFVYESTTQNLRHIMGYQSNGLHSYHNPEWSIPLGSGIAGASFQQSRLIAWIRDADASPFIKPLETVELTRQPGFEMRNLLSIPIFHAMPQDRHKPEPWSCIGVVSFGSSSDASKIPKLFKNGGHGIELDKEFALSNGLSHAAVSDILTMLEHA